MHIINITFCAKLKVYVRSLELFFTTFFEPVSSNSIGLSRGMKRMKNGEWRILEELYETQSKWRKVRRGNFPTKRLSFKGINILNICSCEYFYYKKSALLFFISWTVFFFFLWRYSWFWRHFFATIFAKSIQNTISEGNICTF